MWHKVKLILKQQGQNLENLSPNLLENNDSLLPHLIEQIGVSNVKKMLTGLGVELFAGQQVGNNNKVPVSASTNNKALIKSLIYVNRSFVIVNTNKDNQIDSDNQINDNHQIDNNHINNNQTNTKAFSINPFSSLACFEIRSKATELGLKIARIGFIAPEHAVFKAQQQGKHNANNIKGNMPEGETEDINTLLNVILDKAVKNKVSDVHIAPRNDTNIAIHFRQFGEIVESGVADIKISDYQTFANLLIVAAGGNAGVYARFVEKQFDYKNESNQVNISVRFQQNPSVQRFSNKEIVPSFVLRIHDKNRISSFKSIDEIELLPAHKQILSRAVKHNSGLIIVSGPTGAGKTTMLYAALAQALESRKRIVQTIEDPVEIQIPGIRQTNLCKETGITYENSINKSILRSDVDIALIGEIRSPETAKGVIELDRVGHLVFSTVHTKKTMAIIDRFREFGVQDAYIADGLSVIISARLVKKVCVHCSTIRSASELDIDKKYTGRFISLTDQLSVINRTGCPHCVGGYFGRVSVAEVIKIDNTLQDLIIAKKSASTLEKQVTKHGNKSIWDHGFNLVKRQLTTLEALEMVLPNFADFGDNFSVDEFDRF